jgi:hypothetical protein
MHDFMMVQFLVRAFCVYRISRMVTVETGPFGLFRLLRPPETDHWFNEGMNCPLCASIYVAILVMFLPEKIVNWLALSGLASFLYASEKEWLHKK